MIIPSVPCYFRVAKLLRISRTTKAIRLEIAPENIPTCICDDGCAVNVKGCRIISEKYGIKSPFSRCTSHTSAGTIRRLATLKKMSQSDAVSLYDDLRKVLKHFSQSPKSTEVLKKSLEVLEMNNVHLLNWGSTRMAGFLDACIKTSSIIVPFLDTLNAGNTRPDETKY